MGQADLVPAAGLMQPLCPERRLGLHGVARARAVAFQLCLSIPPPGGSVPLTFGDGTVHVFWLFFFLILTVTYFFTKDLGVEGGDAIKEKISITLELTRI